MSDKAQEGDCMGKKRHRVQVQLNIKDIKELLPDEVKAILRGADDLIGTAGRSMLAKILKGSKDKKLLQHAMDKSPVYGYYKQYKLEDITARIDWLISQGYMAIEYNDRLPVLIYTDKGWEIGRDSYSDELLAELRSLISIGDYRFVHELKDRNRGMILLLLDKIKKSGEKGFIPLLEVWRENDYQKVKEAIDKVIRALEQLQEK